MKLTAKFFDELSSAELYEILKSRAGIFVFEQGIKYVDEDDVDYESLHCFFMENGAVTAYLRAYPDKNDCGTVKLGRVLSLEHGKGTGSELVKQSIDAVKQKMTCRKIHIDAQKHAENFYRKLGFVTTSDEYLEEGIVHVDMELILK